MRVIEASGLTLKAKGKAILDEIDITINEGESIAILGPNGAGKTTLINVILRLQRFKAGTLRNDFLDLPAYKIGVHMQESNLNGLMKVKEVLDLFLFEGDNRRLINEYGLLNQMNQRICTLSGGEKQKLLLILALQNNPEMVVLDEVTTGLDVQSRATIIDFLQREMNDTCKTLIMITHYLEEAEPLCNRFAFLNEGKLVDIGTAPELYSKYNVMKTVCLEAIKPLAIPARFRIKEKRGTIFKIEIAGEQDFIEVMNFISQNYTAIKKYTVNEPSLKALYNRIIEKGDHNEKDA